MPAFIAPAAFPEILIIMVPAAAMGAEGKEGITGANGIHNSTCQSRHLTQAIVWIEDNATILALGYDHFFTINQPGRPSCNIVSSEVYLSCTARRALDHQYNIVAPVIFTDKIKTVISTVDCAFTAR